jgi:hypothetical protein
MATYLFELLVYLHAVRINIVCVRSYYDPFVAQFEPLGLVQVSVHSPLRLDARTFLHTRRVV